ncbi:MAG: ATP-grasp domain-containing protein [Finegoldia magna]|uniref:ATP-grasp domain-containing protein n=1 Tax=Finegoldia magna TaxID=1260 RepID=A0A943L9W7_FINMA|nr:ATP-grasp domain-containing protein [Finegoldia magna]MBS5964989.1 ATP-grasp domain-containing protein [Finegoldia magna]
MKKLLILGGSSYLIPVIEAAKNLGVYTITCDYLPNNIGHKFSDEYHNISITEKDKVYELAKRLEVDGIISFATDPGVVTAAYVCEKLNLPSPPLKSVEILQNKGKFRKFLKENNFNVPYFNTFKTYEDLKNQIGEIKFPVIIKPVDSAGSKGVSRVDRLEDIEEAARIAFNHSFSGEIIVEQFIKKNGNSSDSDCFSVDNELKFASFSSQLFDEKAPNSFVPSAFIWPSDMGGTHKENLENELDRLVKLLDLGTSIYNIETRVGTDDKEYIMEVSPRGGGNRISEILKLATKQDLILNNIKFALGMELDIVTKPVYHDVIAFYVIHSNYDGVFRDFHIDESFYNEHVMDINLNVNKGEKIYKFEGANNTIGNIILRFESYEDAKFYLTDESKWFKLNIER